MRYFWFDQESEENPQVFHHPAHLAFPNMDTLLKASAAIPSRRNATDKPQPRFSKEVNLPKKKPGFSDTQSINYGKR